MSKAVEPTTPVTAEQGYDRGEPKISGLIVTTIGILLILVVTAVGVEFYYHQYKDRVVEQIQLEPVAKDLLDLRAREEQQLGSYGIADKATGAVRLPIARAMELVIADAADGKEKYPVAPAAVKKEEPAAAPGAPAPAAGSPAAPAKPVAH
jgi:hypothetical protein